MISKANDSLGKITDTKKPAKVQVESVLQTQKGVLVLSLCSKEAADWVRQPLNEIAFTEAFSKGLHIRERTFNLVAPRVPIIFKPDNSDHIKEIEEVNRLREHTIHKVRWIKPIGRRRVGQTHAFAILSITSADCTNLLIRDGLIICNTRIRPTKQKFEPIQCMKCRRWGHFAGECSADKDVCGTRRGKHRTSGCQNKDKRWCVTCESSDHASWDRSCPEFSRRCYLVDKRNPENSMPYFPTEQDWTQMARPSRLDLDERFPGKYSVNSLPLYGNRQAESGPRDPRGKGKASQPRSTPKRGYKPTGRAECSYPNSILLDKEGRQHTDKLEGGELKGPLESPEEVDKIKAILTSIHADDSKYILGTTNQF